MAFWLVAIQSNRALAQSCEMLTKLSCGNPFGKPFAVITTCFCDASLSWHSSVCFLRGLLMDQSDTISNQLQLNVDKAKRGPRSGGQNLLCANEATLLIFCFCHELN